MRSSSRFVQFFLWSSSYQMGASFQRLHAVFLHCLQSPHRFTTVTMSIIGSCINHWFFFSCTLYRLRHAFAWITKHPNGGWIIVAEFFGCRFGYRKHTPETFHGYHNVICLKSECKRWIIHIISLLVILSMLWRKMDRLPYHIDCHITATSQC